jgi:DNA invertase Pin-like site-specific DNA recombinase
VVALKLDRIFRDAEDALRQTRAWDKAGVALHLIDMGGQSVNTASAMGRMMLTMMAAFAELERNLIAERTAAALGHKKAHHRVYSPTPFGFDRNGDVLTPRHGEQKIIQQLQAMRAAGWSLRQIADVSNTAGVHWKAGGQRWYAATVQVCNGWVLS